MAAAAPSAATVPSVIFRAVWLSEVWWVSAVSAEVSGVVTAAVPVPPAVQQCLYAAGRGGDREAL